MAKLRLDQTAAWFLSIMGTTTIIGGGAAVLKYTVGGDRDLKKVVFEDVKTTKSADSEMTDEGGDEMSPEKLHRARWSYEGESGPKFWGELSPDYVDCMDGRAQSPVNIEKSSGTRELRPIKFSYKKVATYLENSGTTLQAKFQAGGFISFNGKRFDLLQYHFHLPSEHLIAGVPYEMEMHLVHKSSGGDLAIVAVFLEESERGHPELNRIWRALPMKTGFKGERILINANELLPKDRVYHAYKGSMTIPPCSEDVQWLVLRRSTKVSSKQVENFNLIFRDNSRPTQPLYGRKIMKSTTR